MSIGGIAGLTGLASQVDRVSQNQREMASLKEVETSIAKDNEQSMLAQEMEAKQYEDIAAKSAELLEPDRDKIRVKSLELQANIRSKIEEYGSRKKFFENGGVALLSKYKNDLLSSKETMSYGDNKKNMESLMKLKESGKGHLISSVDLQSLTNYQQGTGDGKITYAGMKSEISMPTEFFDYQQEIPAGNILHYKDNYMGIYSNWAIENPKLVGLQGEELEAQLIEYTYKNHSGMGSNETKRNNDIARQNQKEDREQIAKAGTAEEDKTLSLVAATNSVMNQLQESSPPTIYDMMGDENYIKKQSSKNPELGALFGSSSEYNDAVSNYTSAGQLDKLGKSIIKGSIWETKYAPASSVVVPMMDQSGVRNILFPGSPVAGGVNVGLNSSEYYSPNGEKLKEDFVKESIKGKTNENMTFGGLIYGYIDGNQKMVTQIRDSKGGSLTKKDKAGNVVYTEEQKDHMKGYSGKLTHDMFAVLTNSEGERVYKRLNANQMSGESALAVAIGAGDNIAHVAQTRQKRTIAKAVQEQTKSLNAKMIQTEVARASTTGGVFASPEFMMEAKSAKVADGSNRTTLQKAYYMTATAMNNSGMVDNKMMLADKFYLRGNENNFSNRVGYSQELKDALLNKSKISDVDYIKLFAKVHTGKDTGEDHQDNEVFAQTWTKMYELLNKK